MIERGGTDQRQNRGEEQRRLREAEAASQAKSEFLAMMSHELRTPLNAVIGYAELLDLGIAGSLTAEQRHQLSRIRTSGRHLRGLVNEVLDLAQIQAGHMPVHIGLARAGAAADAALSLGQPRADEKGIRFVGQCLGNADAVFAADEDRVRQVLVNLLSNAVKFTEPGGEVAVECGTALQPEADARVYSHAKWVYLRVRDTGVGIGSEQLPLIFDSFVQGETGHTRSNDGSGLGLTISRRLARLMGGDITVRSNPGEGSAFTLWLPAGELHTETRTPEWQSTFGAGSRLRGLADVGELLVREVETITEALIRRIREEDVMPGARTLKFSQLTDHYPSYIADLGGCSSRSKNRRDSPRRSLGTERRSSGSLPKKHGAQRARLGWTVEHVCREYDLLREELERILRRGAHAIPDTAVDEGLNILERVLEQAQESSVRAFSRARASVDRGRAIERSGTGPHDLKGPHT
jgi:nitrogen-specific signal transduction histidine kinase